MKNVLLFYFLLMVILWSARASAQGGPPMITDDPYTIGANKWEINIAELTIASPSSWLNQSPFIDINYGIGERLQIKYESGVSPVINTSIPYGGAYADTGIRWKFYHDEESDLAISTYPQYSFYPTYYGKNPNVNRSQKSFLLPLELCKKFGKESLNFEIGYGFVNGDDNYWITGLLLGHEISEKWSIMGEWHAQIPVTLIQSQYILNIGTAYDLTETFSLLASLGTSVATSPSFWISYLGIQLHF